MSLLRLYTVFHLNLAYSSIEEEKRPEVVDRCYWPLLRLAREYSLPLGIEAPAYTLESAAVCDQSWLSELRDLTTRGPCEFVGSGYAQLIGPLVPPEVNAANLRLGNATYQRLLGLEPKVALVNEQAYSAGLVKHYLAAGYRGIVMEWDNVARYHPEWDPNWRYFPQRASGLGGADIPLIWTHSIAFQKFQRYVHGEMEMAEYLAYLVSHIGEEPRAFPLYTNDIEVFDFRPGRYHTEAALEAGLEWQRIARLIEALLLDERFEFVTPGQVLDMVDRPQAGHLLRLESPEQPIPVKKQGKYNITRWAVTGRDDLGINTACWRIFRSIAPSVGDEDWRELCYLWSSDFRTHITDKRWQAYKDRLGKALARWEGAVQPWETPGLTGVSQGDPKVERSGHWLSVETATVRLRLNCRRGLAIDGLWLGSLAGPPLCATLSHGYFDDIDLGADWYSGHLVLELPGRPKVTDLGAVEPEVIFDQQGGVLVRAVISTPLGPLYKSLRVVAGESAVWLTYRPDWPEMPVGSLRVGNFTINPDAFERSSLFYSAASGGERETFGLAGTTVEHGDAVSFLVSARHGLGVTDGLVLVGDGSRALAVEVDKTAAALIGLISYRESAGSYFCRLAFSAGEMDETRRPDSGLARGPEFRFRLRLVQKRQTNQ